MWLGHVSVSSTRWHRAQQRSVLCAVLTTALFVLVGTHRALPCFAGSTRYLRLVSGGITARAFAEQVFFGEERAPILPGLEFEVRNRVGDVREALCGTVGIPEQTKCSTLSWYPVSMPERAGGVKGKNTAIVANAGNRFVFPDLIFPEKGVYNILFNISMFNGIKFKYNRTFVVNPQPSQLVMALCKPTGKKDDGVQDLCPAGFNGTALNPFPRAQLRGPNDDAIRTQTPIVRLTVVGGNSTPVIGELTARPNAFGVIQFPRVVPLLPGRVTFKMEAQLSCPRADPPISNDPCFLETVPSLFVVDVKKALPSQIVALREVVGVARFLFAVQPLYTLVDAKGPTLDPRVNMSISLGFNQPSVQYDSGTEEFGVLATLSGKTFAKQNDDYTFVFNDLSINLPGSYDIMARLYYDGELLLTHAQRVTIEDPPTFEVSVIKVNSISTLTLYGRRPKTSPIWVRLSSDADCASFASTSVRWAEESNPYQIARNVSMVPFAAGDKIYVCMQLPVQPKPVKLLQHYLARFDENFPVEYTLSIIDVPTCQALSPLDALRYRAAGWTTAEERRQYGCALTPPAAGTIPPCTCSLIHVCDEFRHSSFQPPGLNIGRCVCCREWVLAIAATVTAVFLSLVLFVIYQWA